MITVREFRALLFELNQDALVTVWDGFKDTECHVQIPVGRTDWSVLLSSSGETVTEEDVS